MTGAMLTTSVLIEIHPVEGKYSASQKSEFMRRATDGVVNVLGCSRQAVVVRIIEVKAENLSRGGIPFGKRA